MFTGVLPTAGIYVSHFSLCLFLFVRGELLPLTLPRAWPIFTVAVLSMQERTYKSRIKEHF